MPSLLLAESGESLTTISVLPRARVQPAAAHGLRRCRRRDYPHAFADFCRATFTQNPRDRPG